MTETASERVSVAGLGVLSGELSRLGQDLDALADDAEAAGLAEVAGDVGPVADAVAVVWAFAQGVEDQVRVARKDAGSVKRRILEAG